MHKDTEVNKIVNLLLSMCDVKVFLTFTFVVKILQVTRGCWWRWFTIDVPPSSLNVVLLWLLFYPFCPNIIINTVIVTGGTKLPNSEQSYKGKVKTHKYINKQNQSTTGKLWTCSSSRNQFLDNLNMFLGILSMILDSLNMFHDSIYKFLNSLNIFLDSRVLKAGGQYTNSFYYCLGLKQNIVRLLSQTG